MSAAAGTIEVVRGRLSEARAEQLLRFWAREARLDEVEARRRLDEVVCVLVDRDDQIAGVNSAYAAPVEQLGGRPMWIYRNLLLATAADAWPAMIHAAWKALDAAFQPTAEGPIGLAVIVSDAAQIERRPEADWVWPKLLYAGRVENGSQLRIRYFGGARLGEPRPVDDYGFALEDRRYRIDVFADQEAVSAQDVVGLWAREGALGPDEARRRVDEVLLVATAADRALVAVGTAYLQHNAQLGLDLWHFRAFVTPDHRATKIGASLLLVARDHLQARFVAGHDVRGAGIVLEVENEMLKRYFDYALWSASDFAFIGENERGDHVRVHYFPGAVTP